MTNNLRLYSIVFLILLITNTSFGQDDNCSSKVGPFIKKLKIALDAFIPDPGNDEARDQFLASLQKTNAGLFNRVKRLVKEAESNRKKDDQWILCFQQEFTKINPASNDASKLTWFAHLVKKIVAIELGSPEFHRGAGFHIDVNQGIADIGKKSEAYSFSARALVAYTFSKQTSGGRFRALGGVSTYYQNTKFLWFVNPRIEFRLKDVGNKLTNLGNLKLIGDANFGKTWIIGGGAGIEFYNFGLQILYQRQGSAISSHILTGLFYRF